MRRFALILALVPGGLAAEEFRQLTGDEILTALIDRKLAYEGGATQTFEPSMRTQYFSSGPSAGSWAVRGDQYCSVWPPSDIWACYNIERSGDVIRFIGAGGDLTDGTYVE
ncbi:hypothetical protein M3P21_16085 [Ruegeria sp. 2012CJ41-6]|uniref:Type II secretion system protein GspG C-terminal domain-containing protein n=1 Tax=Ruegeria spongiae TaxID=2942209 RepID=A0ABT0Q5H7_9RHOB|nr:hypothetical protein [Ruegeria spongiae]MCL6285052.1 hypothetical protein [Ruegeria spongiae]